MLGPPKLRCLDQPVMAPPAELVPKDTFYHHRDATLDLSLVRCEGSFRYPRSCSCYMAS
jgi:hypothetical protein